MSAFSSWWFWILLVGLILVIIGAIIRGVNCEMNAWSGSFFLIGFILVLIGVALALWNWASMANTIEKNAYVSPSPMYSQQYSPQYSPISHQHQVSPGCPDNVINTFKYANHPQVIHSPHVTSSSTPIVSVPIMSPPTTQRVVSSPSVPSLPPVATIRTLPTVVSTPSATSVPLSTSNSPIIPTPVTTNIPQAQRGFSTSGMDLSALSPV